jgi:hypothetical protein
MIRVRDSAAEPPETPTLAGVVERLGSGEKRPFATAVELIELVTAWTDVTPNEGSGSGARSAEEPTT